MKNQKGITLVALVITIVVLLILAGVTISMVMGPNGILTNSQKAKQDSAKGSAKDALTTALAAVQTDYFAGGAISGTAIADVNDANLTKLLPDYTIKTTAGTDEALVEMTDKDGYTFKALVTKDLGIAKFSRTAGGTTPYDEDVTLSSSTAE